MVRLKDVHNQQTNCRFSISIPYGAIKSRRPRQLKMA